MDSAGNTSNPETLQPQTRATADGNWQRAWPDSKKTLFMDTKIWISDFFSHSQNINPWCAPPTNHLKHSFLAHRTGKTAGVGARGNWAAALLASWEKHHFPHSWWEVLDPTLHLPLLPERLWECREIVKGANFPCMYLPCLQMPLVQPRHFRSYLSTDPGVKPKPCHGLQTNQTKIIPKKVGGGLEAESEFGGICA